MPYDKETDTYIPDFKTRMTEGNWEVEKTPGINKPFLIPWLNVIISAEDIPYDNSTSWLSAENVQDAIDELKTLIP